MSLDEPRCILMLSYTMILSGVVVLITLLSGVRAMYGRYTVPSGLVVPPGLDWFIQEFPSFALPAYYFTQSETIEGSVVLSMFVIHYINRTFIFPLQSKSAKGTPWYISLSAMFFCTWNGYMQGAWHAKFATWEAFFSSYTTYLGIFLFFLGMFLNIQSDSILRNLRKPGETGYKIPRGGLFEYVSGANFLGEMIEWTGYALTCWSLPATAFAIFTICNIGPRAIHHHQDYLKKFEDYPKERKAVIPFLL